MKGKLWSSVGHGIYCVDAGYVKPGIACCYLMVEGGEVAIIETGTALTAPTIAALLNELGLPDKSVPAARQFVQTVELFTLAQSLGGVESLCNIPATMTHAAMTAEARAEAGIADGLVRLSVGLETPNDLWADLDQALTQI